MNRRQFLKNSMTASATLALQKLSWGASVDAKIEIFLDEPRGLISPNLYGQFTEHIGGVIYDGVWVGEDSKVPNRHGIRAELVDHLRQIRVPIIRWPGGCFADSYDWMDGVGPPSKRPVRTNFWEVDPDAARLHEAGAQVLETNAFGTAEFARFCQLVGAEPYLAVNLRSLPPLSFDRWVEYCNSPRGTTSLSRMREEGGSPDPFKIRYWGVGNESWGCGGNFTPEEYASEFRRYTSWIPKYGVDLQLIGSGPNSNDLDWTHRVFEQLYASSPYANESFVGWSVHYYSWNLSRGKTEDWIKGKGDALAFDSGDWYELMRVAAGIEQVLGDQWTALGQYDKQHRVKLVVDEYGPWYREGTEIDPTHIFGQQVTVRDALATALTLDTFNRHAEKLLLATNAQLINNINALFLAHEDHFVATPNFHVFSMYADHQGGQSLRTEFTVEDLHYVRDSMPVRFWGLNGSASVLGNKITLTVVNPGLDRSIDAQVGLRGAHVTESSASVLRSEDMHAHNTFEDPDAVKPAPLAVTSAGEYSRLTLPPGSVTKISLLMGKP